MANGQKVTVKVTDVRRSTTSVNGNPSFWIVTDDGRQYRTKTDAMVGYAAENYRPRYKAPPTEVVLTHEGLNTPEQRALIEGGWPSMLDALASALSSHLDV